MTLPFDTRALYRQARWLECVSLEEQTAIGAYSVVEVAESTRPESAETETPDAGRTVLNVQIATSDSPQNTVVVGHMSIAAEGLGYCTHDFPTWARITGSPSVGDEIGLASGAVALAAGYQGYVLLGDLHTHNSVQIGRVIKTGGSGMSRRIEIGLCDTASHNPDTYQTYILYELNSGTTIPSAKSPQETVEAWNECGQILGNANMTLLVEVSAAAGANGPFIAWPLPIEACPGT